MQSLQDNVYFLQKMLPMKIVIIESLTETQAVVLDTILTSQRMLTASKEFSDAPESPSNTTVVTDHQQQQNQQQ